MLLRRLHDVLLPGGYDKKLTFKNDASFISCITKINNTLVGNAEDLDTAMPMNSLIETFSNFNRLFVLSFENEDDETSFSKHYTPSVEIKDFNVLIDGKSFLMFQ